MGSIVEVKPNQLGHFLAGTATYLKSCDNPSLRALLRPAVIHLMVIYSRCESASPIVGSTSFEDDWVGGTKQLAITECPDDCGPNVIEMPQRMETCNLPDLRATLENLAQKHLLPRYRAIDPKKGVTHIFRAANPRARFIFAEHHLVAPSGDQPASCEAT